MKAVVTGGAGFIGHHLVAGLASRDHEVVVLDDFSTGRRSRDGASRQGVDVVEGSILDPGALDRAVRGSEVVFHHAAIASVARSILEPRLTNDVNVAGTIEVMLAAARHGVRRVVFASSAAVYGVPDALPCVESFRPDPRSPYGVSKLAGEHYLHALGRVHGVETAALRYFNVYGPGQDPDAEYAAVVPRFISAALAGQPATINGSIDITRDFVYIDDVVDANLLAANPTAPSGLTCNIAGGTATSLSDLLGAVRDAIGGMPEPIVGPARPGDVRASFADISLASEVLGFSPRVRLGEGIARTAAWFAEAAAPSAPRR